MALANKLGGLLKKATSSNPTLYQAIRSMSSSKLFVGGLSYGTDDHSLKEAFGNYGQVIEARIIIDRDSGRSRGFGFVTYTSSEEASAAITALDGQDLHGRKIRVNHATERTGGFRSGGGGGFGGGGYGGGGYGSGGYGGGGGGGGGYGAGGGGGYGNYSNRMAVAMAVVVITQPQGELGAMTPSLEVTLQLVVVTTLVPAALVVTVDSEEVLRVALVPLAVTSSLVLPLVTMWMRARMTTSWTISSRTMSPTTTPIRGASPHSLSIPSVPCYELLKH
ncbi:hypothetical protein ACP4OV_014366 [Aristida adscensionis]